MSKITTFLARNKTFLWFLFSALMLSWNISDLLNGETDTFTVFATILFSLTTMSFARELELNRNVGSRTASKEGVGGRAER
jgi:hypothetical protein